MDGIGVDPALGTCIETSPPSFVMCEVPVPQPALAWGSCARALDVLLLRPPWARAVSLLSKCHLPCSLLDDRAAMAQLRNRSRSCPQPVTAIQLLPNLYVRMLTGAKNDEAVTPARLEQALRMLPRMRVVPTANLTAALTQLDAVLGVRARAGAVEALTRNQHASPTARPSSRASRAAFERLAGCTAERERQFVEANWADERLYAAAMGVYANQVGRQ